MARGDHIKVRRYGFLYAHHGIDLGDGTVVHFAEPGKKPDNAKVRRTSTEEFLKGGAPHVVSHSSAKALPAEETCRLALEALGQGGDYNLAFNNCEHFARWCKTGRKESVQVWKAAAGVAAAALVVAGAGLRMIRRL